MNASPLRASAREILALTATLAAGAAALAWLGGAPLWTRPMWMDELCTAFVTDHDTFARVIANVAEGGDWAPPLLHLVVWSARRAFGALTPELLRSISLAFVALALVCLYAALRRRVGVAAAAAGLLAFASHPLVVAHAFEGRPYAPWLMFAAAYACALGMPVGRRPWIRDALVALWSVGLCTIHWFGVLSLGLMAGAALLYHGRDWKAGLRLVAPSLVGLVALLVCLPLVFTQRAAAEGLLWVKELQFYQVQAMARLFWFPFVPALALLVLLRHAILDRRWSLVASAFRTVVPDPAFAALVSLALMPVVLMVVSVTVQPSMVDRYGIVTVLAWAPLAAIAVETMARKPRLAALAILSVIVVGAIKDTIEVKAQYAAQVHANQAVYEQAKAMGVPIVFQYMHLIYPVAGPQRSPDMPARFLDIPDSTLLALYPSPKLEWLRRQFRLERSQARLHARIYGFPILATQAALDSAPRFLLLATDLQLPGGYKQAEKWGKAVFPGHKVTRLNDVLSLFEKRATGSPTAR